MFPEMEFDMQLDVLSRLGLRIVYADTHMAPELFIPGLNQCLSEWTEKKGLINAGKYYSLPEKLFYNENIPKGKVSKERNQEYLSVSSPLWLTWEKKYNLRFLWYSEAKEQIHSEETLRRIIVG